MKMKAEKALKIIQNCSFVIAIISTVALIPGIKKDKKITKLDALSLFLNGWVIGSWVRDHS